MQGIERLAAEQSGHDPALPQEHGVRAEDVQDREGTGRTRRTWDAVNGFLEDLRCHAEPLTLVPTPAKGLPAVVIAPVVKRHHAGVGDHGGPRAMNDPEGRARKDEHVIAGGAGVAKPRRIWRTPPGADHRDVGAMKQPLDGQDASIQ